MRNTPPPTGRSRAAEGRADLPRTPSAAPGGATRRDPATPRATTGGRRPRRDTDRRSERPASDGVVQARAAATGPTLVGRRYEVEVERVAHGGSCVARVDGRVVFVRHTLPGERVVAEITEGGEQSRYLRADAVEVLRAAPGRVASRCGHAGPGGCGGCDWQHVDLAVQRGLKAAVVAEQFRRLAGIELVTEAADAVGRGEDAARPGAVTGERTARRMVWDGVEAVPRAAGSGDGGEDGGETDGLGWRTRVQFAVDAEGRLGLRAHRSHEVVPVDDCPLRAPGVAETGAERRRWPGVGTVEVVAATGSADRAVIVTPASVGRDGRRGGSDGGDGRLPLVELDVPVAVFRGDGHGGARRVHGRPHVRERAAGRTWRISGSGFWQVHPGAADLLADAVVAALEPRAGERLLDLYAGVGLFAGVVGPLLGADGEVVAVESDEIAADDARHNLRDLPNAEVVAERVERALGWRGVLPGAVDLVVLDPPRAGAGRKVVEQLVRRAPRRVAYVGCDPAALARDVAVFAEGGYRLAGLRGLDLFPMTHHVECLAVLEPSGAGR